MHRGERQATVVTRQFFDCQGWGRGFESLRPLQFLETAEIPLKPWKDGAFGVLGPIFKGWNCWVSERVEGAAVTARLQQQIFPNLGSHRRRRAPTVAGGWLPQYRATRGSMSGWGHSSGDESGHRGLNPILVFAPDAWASGMPGRAALCAEFNPTNRSRISYFWPSGRRANFGPPKAGVFRPCWTCPEGWTGSAPDVPSY